MSEKRACLYCDRFVILQQGAENVKRPKWFKGFDFDALLRGQYTPPVVPKVFGAGDTQNYDNYPESEDPSQAQVIVEEETNKRIFKDFWWEESIAAGDRFP